MNVLVVAAKWWPLSARLAMALLGQGCRVSALCPIGHPLRLVSGIERRYEYSGSDSIGSLRQALRDHEPTLVVPCDDGVVLQLHALARDEPEFRALIERSLGPLESHHITASRHELLALARELGIAIPPMRLASSIEALVEWHAQLGPDAVLKADGESGGEGVRISHSLDESLEARERLRKRPSRFTAWKRRAINGDPLALWMAREHRDQDKQVIIQGFITGRPANSMMACRDGEVLGLVSVLVVVSDGPTGASYVVRRVENEAMTRAAVSIAARLRLTGFYGLDYIVESATGTPFLIEMNPRCTQLGHLDFQGRGSVVAIWAAAMQNQPRVTARAPIAKDAVAFFPQALRMGPAGQAILARSFLDVPSSEAALVAELERPPAPQRSWLAAVYHAFRPVMRNQPMIFENLESNVYSRTSPGNFGQRRSDRWVARLPHPEREQR
jgi:hypothetical protein